MSELLDVLKVTVLPEYRLALEFENGEHRTGNHHRSSHILLQGAEAKETT